MGLVDEEFLAQLEACTLPSDQFHHADHLRAAWLYLHELPLPEAMERFSRVLKAYATSLGKPERYHETVTWAYMLLVNERIRISDISTTWEEFTAANADLFDWKNSILLRYYLPETLDSQFAREVFVMPNRGISLHQT